MWHWSLKSLVTQPVSLAASVLAAGSALLLVLLFEAVYAGESKQVVAYVEHSSADVWVMQRGVANMHMATSYLSDWKARQVAEVPGVARVDAILYLNTVVGAGASRFFSYVVGLDSSGIRAGPWAVAAGNAMPERGEAVVPVAFSKLAGIELGDTVRIADRELVVAGLSEGTFSLANSVVFVSRPDLEDLMNVLDIVSFLLVEAAPGVDPDSLAREIEQRVDHVSALSREAFLANDRSMARQMGVETIALMTVIGGSLAALLVAFTCYSLIARQYRELAVVSAMGATKAALYGSVMLQGLLVTAASVVVAVVLAVAALPVVTFLVPQVTLQLTAGSMARVAIVGLVVAALACAWAARRVARVDPATAFGS